MSCSICKGKGHILKNGKWVKCSCLAEARLSSAIRGSGVCKEFVKAETTTDTSRAMTITNQFISKLESGLPKMAPLFFTSHKAEYYAARYIEAALKHGFSAKIIELADMTDLFFNREQGQFSSLFIGPDLLGLRIGMEIPNSVASSVLTIIIRTRRLQGKSTFLISSVSPLTFNTRYNSEISNMLRDTKQFVPVEVK